MKKLLTILIMVCAVSSAKAQMYWNQAAQFAGNSSSYVSVANSSSLNITGSFTLEAWVNPSNTLNKGVISKGGSLGTMLIYGIRITNSRIVILTNGAPRLSSKTTSLVPTNTWTHIAATYNASTSVFRIFINGVQDTTATVASATPNSNTDSLFIGISGASTPFAGKIDEVRVWNIELSQPQISALMKSNLGISGDGITNTLPLCITFQNNIGTTPYFSVSDNSLNNNVCFARNVTAFDLKDRPSGINQFSDCAYFPSVGGGFIGGDNAVVSPTNRVTIECWVFPKEFNSGILYKGNFIANTINYGLKIISGKLGATINSVSINSNDSVKRERWSHIAFTYFAATGAYEFYINGKRGTVGNITPGNIVDGTDSLGIGAHPGIQNFTGFMDELRISSTLKTAAEINSQMFTSVNESNDNDTYNSAVYNFDASTFSNTSGGPRLLSRGTVTFTYNGGFTFGYVQSPLNNYSNGSFQGGFYLNMPNKRVPATGSTGTVRDTIEILSSETINDLNVFVALNHSNETNISISLTSPLGATTELFAGTQLIDFTNNLVTTFDSDADSSLVNGRYINFGPLIKPQFNLDAIFSGNNPKGKWILTVTDLAGSDTGFLSSWGLQFNDAEFVPFNLECTAFVEGFYNAGSNSMITDTMRYYIHSASPPYQVIDSSISYVNSSGNALVPFLKVQPSTVYLLAIKHRNMIETWSSSPVVFSQYSKQTSYNFTDFVTKAFGNNMKQVDASPVRFAAFSGDVNQDDIVDGADGILIDNDAANFNTGYLSTDLNGDDNIDGSDALLADNNAAIFVTAVIP